MSVNAPSIHAPLVSIVVPAYNHADHLAQAIDSVLAQDYPRVELIVLDDGSTDETRVVLQRYGDRFYWETHPNMGQAATLNKGWAMSRGDILSYLSADDRLLPHAVAEAVTALNACAELAMTYCDFHLIDQSGQRLRTVTTQNYDYFEMVVDTVCIPGPGVFLRRDAWRLTGGWDVQFRQWPDYDYWIRLGLQGPFMRIATPCAEFRVHENSQTFMPVAFDRAEEPIKILQRYYADPRKLTAAIVAAKSRALGSAALASAQLHFRAGRATTGLTRACMAARKHWQLLFAPRTWKLIIHGLFSRPVWSLRLLLRKLS